MMMMMMMNDVDDDDVDDDDGDYDDDGDDDDYDDSDYDDYDDMSDVCGNLPTQFPSHHSKLHSLSTNYPQLFVLTAPNSKHLLWAPLDWQILCV